MRRSRIGIGMDRVLEIGEVDGRVKSRPDVRAWLLAKAKTDGKVRGPRGRGSLANGRGGSFQN
jgi:hypothetical protein